MEEKFLPIGTVCKLKDADIKFMITGYLPTIEDETKEQYDYFACVYPIGVFGNENTLAFNHDKIDKIYYIGYTTDNYLELDNKLNNIE